MRKVCYTIDTEGDSTTNTSPTYYGNKKVLPRILDMFDRYKVKATFFIQEDKFVQLASDFPNLLRELQEKGHEIGYHAHGLEGSTKETQEDIITNGLEKLRDLGYNPVSFRAGRYHFNVNILKILEKNSIKYDSSVVPGLKEVVNGVEWNNHVGANTSPYFPSYKNHCEKGSSKIFEIPINRIRSAGTEYGNTLLTGFNTHEKKLFDYFYNNVKDQVIVVSIHPWQGLNKIFHRFNRKFELYNKKRYEYMTKLVGAGLNTFGVIVSKKYLQGFNDLLDHISKKNVEFITIKNAGEYMKKNIGE